MTDIETQLRDAYAAEHLTTPETSLRSRARRRRVRLAATGIVLVGLVGAGSIWGISKFDPQPSAIQAMTDPAARRTICDKEAAEKLDAPLPEETVTFAAKGEWVQLYLGPTVIVSCMGPYGGFPGGDGDQPEILVEITRSPYRDQQQTWFDGAAMTSIERSFQDGQSWRIVAVPAGTEKAEMTAADNTVVPAVLVDGKAIGWLPIAAGVGVASSARVSAYTKTRTYTLVEGKVTERSR
jgi:hypothetical protein